MGSFEGKFESAKQNWTTPKDLFLKLDKIYNFNMDLAADENNCLCEEYLDEEIDALSIRWKGFGNCYLNPPYGSTGKNKLSEWVRKAYEECTKDPNLCVCMLIPARTNTEWFHRYCMNAKTLLFIQGRPKFGGAIHGLPQPLLFVVFQQSEHPVEIGSLKI